MLAWRTTPTQNFDENLALLQAGGVRHISAYLLKIEPGTPFGKCPPPGLPEEDDAAALYLYAAQRLAEAGYARYELSNFAQAGFEGRHTCCIGIVRMCWG